MLTLRRFKGTVVFVALAVLLIGAVWTYADTTGGYIASPSLYWSVAIYDVYFAGLNSHSGHSYAIENYSDYRLEVAWEYSHKVMRPNGTLYEDDSTHGTFIVKPDQDKYGRGERGVRVMPGRYYLDTYTSIDILYERKRPDIPRRIKYKKLPIVTSETTVQ